MRNLEDIEKNLAEAREALSTAEGTPAEVYSRIVGYYRSVRNWNRGKKEEYGERRLYRVCNDELHAAAASPSFPEPVYGKKTISDLFSQEEVKLMLFIRNSCPGCQPAKAAANRLGIPVELISADTSEGMAEALKRGVLATPTAILLSSSGKELQRAGDANSIGKLGVNISMPHSISVSA